MIEAVGLTKRYGSTLAVNDLSFSVRPGVVTGFLGPNGAGKSTTMRMILGLDTPTSGRALIDGQPYAKLRHPLTRVGSLLDANWVHPNRSGRSHLRFMAAASGLPVKRVDEVLDVVGLTQVGKKGVGKYSLGMKQRLGIAGALLGRPQILLFDEPVNGLDPEGILWIRNFMKQLAADGSTVLVSSHLLSEMAVTADHLVVIGRGRLIADATTADFISQATRTTVKVRSPQLEQLKTVLTAQGVQTEAAPDSLLVLNAPTEQVGDIAAANGLTLHELSSQRGSLEEAFISLTGGATEYTAHHDVAGGPPIPGAPTDTPEVLR
jgi:ABC-2 type transport system ATP-binding protein